MWQSKGKVAVAGIGFSKLVRHSERSLGSLALGACLFSGCNVGGEWGIMRHATIPSVHP